MNAVIFFPSYRSIGENFASSSVTFQMTLYFLFTLASIALVQSVRIGKISHARISNTTSTIQSNCSSCICQCYSLKSSSSHCCQVNCFVKNDTCQVIRSSSSIDSSLIIDTSSTVYLTNCSTHATVAATQSTTGAINTESSTVRISWTKTGADKKITSQHAVGAVNSSSSGG